MLRSIYQGLLRLHPPTFRKRFAEEMQSIFEQVTERSARVKLWADGSLSLLRQWSLRRSSGTSSPRAASTPRLTAFLRFILSILSGREPLRLFTGSS